jgi:membrane protein required for colicin V production
MNSFDIVVAVCVVVVMTIGFKDGLLRSGLTILGYLLAMPIAVWLTSLLAPQWGGPLGPPQLQNSLMFFAIFLVAGIVLGSLLRMAVNDAIGSEIGLGDRLGGAALGAVRVMLIAITMVLIFDRLIPADLQPGYLVGSKLRPLLSAAGQQGFKALPPDLTDYIDQLKRTHRI